MINSLYDMYQRWSYDGSVWLYSDPHFGDADMQKYFNYPSDEEQIANINKKCGKLDTLIMLGDIGDVKKVKELRCKHLVIIAGNHDKLSELKKIQRARNLKHIWYVEIYEGPVFVAQKLVLSHEPLPFMNYALNIHGHNHAGEANDLYHYNVAANAINFQPVNLGKLIKDGVLSHVQDIHRITINEAAKRVHDND